MSQPSGPEGEPELAPLRHRSILDSLVQHGQVNTQQLATRFGVTHETVRKDLIYLQERGLLRRVHAGAVGPESVAHEPWVNDRTDNLPQKRRIAAAAAELVPASGAVLLDSGSTTAALAHQMQSSGSLQVITNSLPVALTLLPKVGSVTTLGGRVRPETQATADEWALAHLSDMRVDVAFLGANAACLDQGLATPDRAEAAVKAAFIRTARRRVLLADHSKFERESVYSFATLTDIDVLVTDAQLSARTAAAIERTHLVEVIRASA
ncbi:MAG TPA: DeoR/GlpR family DNA-binding transcription regulator [Ornithinimicrobium sp.]|uniref:DeoR/GlpR family DNA-binding transcription regulator n=1 Tax=Ornithinimicrobium sp. TaxID=1977084 RepID=UPI002B499CF2|nr:DeoR/GlpR family DNA-binding transcription regulator [Ornithinimicrobium sp.]HKJ11333.1 DeoR/GlpR family DNA-binding transcription regulator [Ornithinimicrobium sp.]